MLSYYIGQYLIPSVIGKVTDSFRTAELSMYFLSVIGLYMIWLIMIAVCKAKGYKQQIICLLSLFFFGGLIILGQAVAGNLYPKDFPYGSYEWMNPYTVTIQYSFNWSLLKWVPGQAIVPWLAVIVLLLRPQKAETYVMTGLPVIMFSGFAMAGIAVMMLALGVYSLIYKSEQSIWKRFRSLLSPGNILLATVLGGILVLYFMGNISGDKPEYLSLHLLNYGKKKIFYFIFCFFMFGHYALLIWKENRKNPIYWITVASLCIYPLFSMGMYNDFTMRASIPALFTLLILVLQFLFHKDKENENDFIIRRTLTAACLIIGMIYPLLSLRETVINYKWGEVARCDIYGTLEQFANTADMEINDDLKYNYYSYNLEKDIFYKYLAK